MGKSIFDIIGKNLNIDNEYRKIYKGVKQTYLFAYTGNQYTIEDAFNKVIEDWPYRGTCTNLNEILFELNLGATTFLSPTKDILYLIELTLNMIEFVRFQRPYYRVVNKVLIDNIYYVLNVLGYRIEKTEECKVILIKDDADALDTALTVEDEDIAKVILNYKDFKIENDVKAKQDLLRKLGLYVEPLRNQIGKINSELEDYIFFNLNKLHIRHNNKDGKLKIEFVANMKDDELIEWYDKTYTLILTAIRMLEFEKNKLEFKGLKKEISG